MKYAIDPTIVANAAKDPDAIVGILGNKNPTTTPAMIDERRFCTV
jgi:hypothetical protein